jgi:hypothetical protein
VCVSFLAVALPTLTTLFGAQLTERDGMLNPTPFGREARLDGAARLVVSRLAWARSDLHLVGATSTVTQYLRQPDVATRLAVTHDLYAFVATMDGCRRIVLAPVAAQAIVADREMERPACGHLLAMAANLPSGEILLERASATDEAAARLCMGVSLTASPNARAALVAEYDPGVLFADLTALFPGEGGPFLRESRGLWVIAPPAAAKPLASRTFLLPSWQGPSGGRWEIALARRSDAAADQRRELPVALSLLAASALALVSAYAVKKRREQLAQLARVDGEANPAGRTARP